MRLPPSVMLPHTLSPLVYALALPSLLLNTPSRFPTYACFQPLNAPSLLFPASSFGNPKRLLIWSSIRLPDCSFHHIVPALSLYSNNCSAQVLPSFIEQCTISLVAQLLDRSHTESSSHFVEVVFDAQIALPRTPFLPLQYKEFERRPFIVHRYSKL